MKPPRKPKDLMSRGTSYKVAYIVPSNIGAATIVVNHEWFFSPKECRRLMDWLERAVTWIEWREKNDSQ